MEQPLDDVLNGVEPEEVPVEEVKTEDSSEVIETKPEEDPKGGEVPEETPATKDEESEPWTKTAYLDEKRKRQDAQNRVKELESQLSGKKETAPDIFEDQEQYTSYLNSQISSAVNNTKAEISEFFARRDHDDIDEKFERFKELAEQNPELKREVAASKSPWHTMRDIVIKAEEMEALKDVDSYKAKLRAEIEAELKAEIEGKATAEKEKLESITPSLAGARSSGTPKDPIDQSLEEILGR